MRAFARIVQPVRPPTSATDHPFARPLRDALRAVVLAHRADVDSIRPCGTPLPLTEAHALIALLEHGPLSASGLSAHLDIDRTNVSRLLSRLEAEGLVTRGPDPDDGRARLSALTARGQAVATAADRASRAHFTRIIEALGDTTAGVAIDALKALAPALRNATKAKDSLP